MKRVRGSVTFSFSALLLTTTTNKSSHPKLHPTEPTSTRSAQTTNSNNATTNSSGRTTVFYTDSPTRQCTINTKNDDHQVYRATLVTGEVVAVKVQRPDVLESVTLDLYVIRLILLFVSKNDSTRESALSILGVIDNWADRFLQELDYLQEAANGDRWVVVAV